MAGAHGTALIRFKRAYVDLIDARTAEKCAYQSPEEAKDMLGESGSGIACWFADDDTGGEFETMIEKGAPHWIDETAHPMLRIQSLAMTTDESQETVDGRASQLLYWAIAVLLNDPSCGLVDDDIQEFFALPERWRYFGGVMDGKRAARFELFIEVQSRLKLVLA